MTKIPERPPIPEGWVVLDRDDYNNEYREDSVLDEDYYATNIRVFEFNGDETISFFHAYWSSDRGDRFEWTIDPESGFYLSKDDYEILHRHWLEKHSK